MGFTNPPGGGWAIAIKLDSEGPGVRFRKGGEQPKILAA